MNKTIICPYCSQKNEILNAELYGGKKVRIPCGNRNCTQKFDHYFEIRLSDEITEITQKNVYGREATLTLLENEYHKEMIFKLNPGEEIFGRNSNIGITAGQINSVDKTISRKHFKITGIKERRTENVRFIIEDLQSINSLFINGLEIKSIIKAILQHNDEIGIGNSRIIFKYTDIEQ